MMPTYSITPFTEPIGFMFNAWPVLFVIGAIIIGWLVVIIAEK